MRTLRVFKSFRDAGRGVAYVFRHEQNFRIQLCFALVVIAAMFVFGLRTSEMVVVLLLIVLVLLLEFLNSAFEKFIDIVKPRLAYQVEVIKDILAAMVLFASLGASVIGLIIFWPHILRLFL